MNSEHLKHVSVYLMKTSYHSKRLRCIDQVDLVVSQKVSFTSFPIQSLCFFQALVLQKKGKFLELVDPRLGSNYDKKEALRMVKVALRCTNPSPALRPNMSTVVNMLEGRLDVDESNFDSSGYGDEFNFQGLRDKYDEMQVTSSENHSVFLLTDTKDTDCSSSTFPSTSTSK